MLPFASIARSALVLSLVTTAAVRTQSFPNFESPQISPVAVSADGSRLLVVNTPDNRVALFSLGNPLRPLLLDEIEVGLEPVSVAFRDGHEAWVVNHLSDSVSIVDLDAGVVVDTLQVEDEPSAIVFAGSGRAFVTTATRRLVQVFDTTTRTLVGEIPLFCDQPRFAVASEDGTRVFVAAHHSGNETTIVKEGLAPPQPPPTNTSLPTPPSVGLIVDSEDPTWINQHNIDLPDYDVFEIDASSLSVLRRISGVGTTLFGMAVHPTSGDVWIANTEARNLVRFEPTLRGHLVDHRVTRIARTPGSSPQHFDLNPGVDYALLPNPHALATAVAQPTDVEVAPDGSEFFVAGFGSDRIAVLDANGAVLARIEIGDASSSRRKRGPRGMAHHPTFGVLYVVNRLANSLSIVDTGGRAEVFETPLVFDPTPGALKEGRGFLYDTKLSGNGLSSCAVCHIDATLDGLAWDLGDPGGSTVTVPGALGSLVMHPMKGPMATQTLVGLESHEPFHWRGDKVDFEDFNGAFDSLLGGTPLPAADMSAYADFIDTVRFGPNPNRNVDDSLPTTPVGLSAADGEATFRFQTFNGFTRCVDCHSIDAGTNDLIFPGPILGESQGFKVPHLRNIYKRDGRKDSGGGLRTSGFGQLHDGSDDDVFDLLSRPVFGPLATNTTNKTKLRRFVEAFDTGTKPTVGMSLTMNASNYQAAGRIADRAVLTTAASAGHCDLVVRGEIDGTPVGLLFDPGNADFEADRAGAARSTLADFDFLLAQGRATLTFVGVPPGQGRRIGIDRDDDGVLDGDEAATAYGAATPGCALTLRESSPARVGNSAYTVVTEGAQVGAAGVLFLGFGSAAIPFLGVDILVDPAVLVTVEAVADAEGSAAFSIAISDSPGLTGLQFYVQSLFLDSCGSFGLAASQGLAVTVGN